MTDGVMEKGEKIPGRRVHLDAENCFRLEPGDYCKMPNGSWMARNPEPRFHLGDLSGHQITEHEDGTITASPSIGHTEPNVGYWHGYLERGVWRKD